RTAPWSSGGGVHERAVAGMSEPDEAIGPATAGADTGTQDRPRATRSSRALGDGDVSLLALVDRLSALLERSDLTELEVEAGGAGQGEPTAPRGRATVTPPSSDRARTSRQAHVTGWGRYAPAQVLTNADLERMVDTSDEWIRSRTGIRERRVAAAHETTASMAAVAGLRAIA